MKTHVLGLVALWSLVGCTSLSYQEPLQGPRARVRFVTTSAAPTVLRAYDDANCAQNESEWMRLREGPLVNSQPKKLGMPLWNHHENAAKEVHVDSSKPMHGMFFGQEPVGIGLIHTCAVPFSFSFAENRDYEVKYHFIPRQCHVTISSIAPNGDGWVYKTAAKFGNRATEADPGLRSRVPSASLELVTRGPGGSDANPDPAPGVFSPAPGTRAVADARPS